MVVQLILSRVAAVPGHARIPFAWLGRGTGMIVSAVFSGVFSWLGSGRPTLLEVRAGQDS